MADPAEEDVLKRGKSRRLPVNPPSEAAADTNEATT